MPDFPPASGRSHLRKMGQIPLEVNEQPWALATPRPGARPCLTTSPDLHLAQGLQPLLLRLLGGQLGQLSEQQLGWRGGDVQEVGEGLAE